jgi:hypothetical protein
MVTLHGKNGSSMRLSLRAPNTTELNALESSVRTGAALFDLGIPMAAFQVKAIIFDRIDTSSRAGLEQMAVLERDMFPSSTTQGLNGSVSDASGRVIARTGMLPHNGKLTPAYSVGGTVYYVE